MGKGSKRSSRRERIVSVITVVVLSSTAVLTAWCGFESSKWGGEMSIAFSQASSSRIQAAAADGTARDARQYDLSLYIEWVRAVRDGDTDLADYVKARFTPELTKAFDAWTADGRTENGPLVVDAYVPPGTEKAEKLDARADAKFASALVYNQRGDNYSLLTVLFALVLFLTALSQREDKPWMRHTFLGLAVAAGIVCLIVMLTFPIKV